MDRSPPPITRDADKPFPLTTMIRAVRFERDRVVIHCEDGFCVILTFSEYPPPPFTIRVEPIIGWEGMRTGYEGRLIRDR